MRRCVALGLLVATQIACPSDDDDGAPPEQVTARCRPPIVEADAGVVEPTSCDVATDCAAGMICAGSGLCVAVGCHRDEECGGTEVCVDAQCVARLAASDVALCLVLTEDRVVSPGERVDLVGEALTPCGQRLPEVELTWRASSDAVQIDGATAVAGDVAGVATVDARVGDVLCDGAVRITNAGASDTPRVFVRARTGEPIAGARIAVGTEEATTDASGLAAIDASAGEVTISAEGFVTTTLVETGVSHVDVVIERARSVTRPFGVRGKVRLESARPDFLTAAVAHSALVPDFSTSGFASTWCGDFVTTPIVVPQLLIDAPDAVVPGASMFAIGGSAITNIPARCGDLSVGPGELGCFTTSTPADASRVWSLGGTQRSEDLTDVPPLLFDGLDDSVAPCAVLGTYLWDPTRLFFGLADATPAAAARITDTGTTADCSNADRAGYEEVCVLDAASHPAVTVSAEQPLEAVVAVDVDASQVRPCFGLISVHAGVLDERGALIPLGIGQGITGNGGDCAVIPRTIGRWAAQGTGQVGVFVANTPYEFRNRPTALLVSTVDRHPDRLRASSAFVRTESLYAPADVTLLGVPEAAIEVASRSVAWTSIPGATHVQVELRLGDDAWQVWVDALADSVVLPEALAPWLVDGARLEVRAVDAARAPWEALTPGAESARFAVAACTLSGPGCSTAP